MADVWQQLADLLNRMEEAEEDPTPGQSPVPRISGRSGAVHWSKEDDAWHHVERMP